MFNEAKVWLGCLASYNNGDLIGKWVDLTKFDSQEEFHTYISEYFAELDKTKPLDYGQPREEWQFNDWEGIPDHLISQYGIDPKFWELKEKTEDFDESQCKALHIFLDQQDFESTEKALEFFERSYCGYYDSHTPMKDFAEERAENEFGDELLTKLGSYFDYAHYQYNLELQGYWQEDGHIFAPF